MRPVISAFLAEATGRVRLSSDYRERLTYPSGNGMKVAHTVSVQLVACIGPTSICDAVQWQSPS